MSKLVHAFCAALVAAPLIGMGTDAAAQGAQSGGAQAAAPAPRGGGGGFRGGGGGFRGGGFRDRDNFRFRGGFYGGFGPRFGFYDPWYDPFWGPRFGFGYGFYGSYPYGYYPPPVIVRDRVPEPGYLPPPDEPAPQQNWYRCDNPQGFYPYVRNCNGPWQSVPVTPPSDGPGAPQR
jgi:hypothetical protein